jgi:hypothetical protein
VRDKVLLQMQRWVCAGGILLASALVSGCGGGGGGQGNSISISPTSLTFNAAPNGQLPPSQQVAATYQGAGVVVGYPTGSSVPSWLSIQTAANSATDPATFNIAVNSTNFTDGQVLTTTVRFVTGNADGSDPVYVDMPVTYNVVGPTLVLTPSSLSFTVNGGTQGSVLSQTIQVSDSNGGTNPAKAAAWSVQSTSAPWITVSPTSGTSAPPATLTVTINPSQVPSATDGTTQNASFTLQYLTEAKQTLTVNVPVSLTIYTPTVQSAAPYYAYTTTPSEVVLRGSHLTGLSPSQVHLGTATATSLRTIDSQRIGAMFSSAPSGVQHLHIDNLLNQDLSQASVNVVAPAAYAASGLTMQVQPAAMLLDPTRNMLFITDAQGTGVFPYQYSSGTWQALPEISSSGTMRAQMSPDGTSLLLLNPQLLQSTLLDPAPGTLSTVLNVSASSPIANECEDAFYDFGVLDNGDGFVTSFMKACEPDSVEVSFPQLTSAASSNTVFNSIITYSGRPAVIQAAEYSYVYVAQSAFGNNNYNDQATAFYDPDTGQGSTVATPANLTSRYAAISASGTRIVLTPTSSSTPAVFDTQFDLLGLLNVPNAQIVAMSPDAHYIYWPDATNNEIHVVDLSTQPAAGAYYAETTPLPWSVDSTFAPQSVMITPDGQQLFIYGADSSAGNRILIANLH